MAGGDGSLITHLMKAKSYGIDLEPLLCCALPYGTGNDTARVLGWGGEPNLKYYKSLKLLMTEICLNTEVIELNVWDVSVSFKKNGDTFNVDEKTRKYRPFNTDKY